MMSETMPRIKTRLEGDILILTLRGTFGDSSDKVVHSAFDQLELAGVIGVVVNINEASFTGTHIVGEFIPRLMQLKEATGQVQLVTERQHWWLTMSKLNQVFETYEDEAQVITSMTKPAE